MYQLTNEITITKENGYFANTTESEVKVPITYNGRTYEEGKKIKISDGLIAIITLITNYCNFNY